MSISSILGLATRITQLNAVGQPTDDSVLIRDFVSFKFSPVYEGGDFVGSKNGTGVANRRMRTATTLKKLNLELVLCGPRIRAFTELETGSVFASGAWGVGYSPPDPHDLPSSNIAIETWTRAVRGDQQVGYIRWLFPHVNLALSGEVVADEGTAVTPTFTGWGRQNSAFGVGRDGFWSLSQGRVYQSSPDTQLPS